MNDTDVYLKCNNRRTSTKKLFISDIVIKKQYVKISITHNNHKWIENVGAIYHNNGITLEFNHDNWDVFSDDYIAKYTHKQNLFELCITENFLKKYNLDKQYFARRGKYETEIVFLKRTK